MLSKAYVMKRTLVDAYLTEFHPAGCKSQRPCVWGSSDMPQDDHFPWHGEQVFKTPQEAQERIKEHVKYFKDNYPAHTDLDEESDFAVYEVEVDWDEDVYTDPMMEYLENKTNYHLHNSVLILRKAEL